MAILDIKDNKFWKCLYIVLRATFPALKLLCYYNANKPSMDKIFSLSHRTTLAATENSIQDLNNEELFGSLSTDANLTQGGSGNNNLDLDSGSDSDDEDEQRVRFTDSDNDDETLSQLRRPPIIR